MIDARILDQHPGVVAVGHQRDAVVLVHPRDEAVQRLPDHFQPPAPAHAGRDVDQKRQPRGRATRVQRPSGLNPKLQQPRAAAVQRPSTGHRQPKCLARRPRELVVDRRQELLGPQRRRRRQLAVVEIALGQFVAGRAGSQRHRHALQPRIEHRPHQRMEARAAEEEYVIARDDRKIEAHGLQPRHLPQIRRIVQILGGTPHRPVSEIGVGRRIQTRGTEGLGQRLARPTGPRPVGRQHLRSRRRRRRHDRQVALDQKPRDVVGEFLLAPRGSDPSFQRRLLRQAADQRIHTPGHEHQRYQDGDDRHADSQQQRGGRRDPRDPHPLGHSPAHLLQPAVKLERNGHVPQSGVKFLV